MRSFKQSIWPSSTFPKGPESVAGSVSQGVLCPERMSVRHGWVESATILTLMGSKVSEESGVVGEGDREPVAVADEDDVVILEEATGQTRIRLVK
jgi:hypothetical protein